MRKYIGELNDQGQPKQAVIGVPARDLTEEEWRDFVKSGLIVEGEQTGDLWQKAGEKDKDDAAPPGRARGKDGD